MASPWIYAARRLALAVPLLLGMSVLVFGLMRLVPGDPAVVVRGDFGVDFRQNEPIGRMILDRLPVTLELTLVATAGAALIGIPLGLLGGARRRGFADRATLAIGLVGVSIPDFWLGIMLMLGLSLGAGVLPSGGFVPIGESLLENLH